MESRFGIYRRLFGYLGPHWPYVAVAYAAMIATTLINLFIPQIIKQAIDRGLTEGQAGTLFIAAALILGIAIIRGSVSFAQRYYGQWLTHRVALDLRNRFYTSVQHLPFAFHDKAQTGDLMSRATGDITETERFAGIGLLDLSATLFLLVGVTVAMVAEDAKLALLVLAPLAALVLLAIYFGNTIRPMFKSIQEQMGQLSSIMQESMTGIGVVKAFAREGYELGKFDVENDEWFRRRYAAIRLWGKYWPTFTLILSVAVVLLLWYGGRQAIAGAITVGSLFAMISYVLMLSAPVSRLGFLVNLAATASASASRVFEIIDTPSEVVDAPEAVTLTDVRGEVRFENVTFGYQSAGNVLKEVSFVANPGDVVALIGPTGSGKSTITNLIPRFYDATSGRVLLDGIDVRKTKLHSLRDQIAIVLQAPFLFNDTIASNIAYGRPEASMDEIVAAAKTAAAHEFIVSFPDGYHTTVGERGVTLSGGQKQRIAIARAVICDPRILILDDSTSSVDTETEHLIQQALAVIMENRTTFVIAQRLLTLKSADQILVLDDGRIVERGVHDELLQENGLYRQIYDLQLRDQEEFTATQRRLATSVGNVN
jgi:ATP-binding cassette, subfamily B, multidrug efflux pump